MHRFVFLVWALFWGSVSLAGWASVSWAQSRIFTLTLRNISTPEVLYAVDPSPLAQTVWAVHSYPDPFFTEGRPARPNGLEILSEDGSGQKLVAILKNQTGIRDAGVAPLTPLLPGQSTSVAFSAVPGQFLSVAVMLIQSNDKFFGTTGEGIPLFNANGEPLLGDVTSNFYLWDSGTEMDELPGQGAYQPLRQPGGNTGFDENGVVVRFQAGQARSADGYAYPAVQEHIQVTLH